MSKAIKNAKEISKRTVVIVSLLVMLVFSLISLSFAWYRNYLDIDGMDVTTGKMSFELQTYHVYGDNSVSDPEVSLFDGETENSVVLESQVTNVQTWAGMPHHVYYFIKNPATEMAIDLDASLVISLDNVEIPEAVGAIKVSIVNVKEGSLAEDFEGVTNDDVKAAISTAATNGEIQVDSNKIAFSALENTYREFMVETGEYICYRLSYEVPANLATYQNMELGIRVSFCLAQKGGLPGTETSTEYVVYSNEGLQTAMGKYRPNDKIVIKGNIEYVGDLIFNRPVSLTIQNADLIINGNLTYAYPYQGHFLLDTSKGGRIIVLKKGIEQTDSAGNVIGMTYVGGNFDINIPNAQMEVIGKNNTAAGRGDIYVQADLFVAASKSGATAMGEGFIVNASRIVHTNGIVGDSNELKTINVGDYTKITVLQYTTLGPIISENKIIEIENRGTIQSIDLYDMKYDDKYTRFEPQIFIDNYGQLTNTTIQLPPNWAQKFGQQEDLSYVGNTRIVSNPGAGAMQTNTCSSGFKSDGSKDPEKDHIEYVKLHTFIEKVNELPTEIVVQYTEDTDLWNMSTGVKVGSTLQSLIEYYSGAFMATNKEGSATGSFVSDALKIAEASSITSMKIVCLNTQLTSNDYQYIRGNMPQLRTLDLSDASSVGLALPVYALQNMSNLTTFIPSQYDTSWATNYIFQGTGITELWLPNSLTSVTSNAFANSNIQYIHTSSTIVSGLHPGVNGDKVFLFVPDQESYNYYNANGNNLTYYAGKVFMEATRYSTDSTDYFLRLNQENATCEVATIIAHANRTQLDAELEKANTTAFDFATVKIDNFLYDIVSYDAYAFKGRAISGTKDIVFGEKLQTVKKGSFGSITGIDTVRFKGPTTISSEAFLSAGIIKAYFEDDSYIEENAFQSSKIREAHGENVTELDTKAFNSASELLWANFPSLRFCYQPFVGCSKLVRVDIGILADGSYLLQAGHVRYLFVHSKEGDIMPSTPIESNNTTSRLVILPSAYQNMFKAPGTKIVLDEGYEMSDVQAYYDPVNPVVVQNLSFPNYYYIIKDDGTIKIVLSFADQITESKEVFDIPGYTISEIGNYAYTYTNIRLKNEDVVFPNGLKTVGYGGFACVIGASTQNGAGGTVTSTKTYRTLQLNQVETVGAVSFVGNTCISVVGKNLITLNAAAFTRLSTVISIDLPSVRYAYYTGQYTYQFASCNKLRMLQLGPLDQARGTWGLYEVQHLELVIVNNSEYAANYPADWFNVYQTDNILQPVPTVVHTGTATILSRSYSINNVIVCGIKTYTETIGGAEYSIDVPTMIYSKNDEVSVTMRKYMHDSLDSGNVYRVPSVLLNTGETMDLLGHTVPVYEESLQESGDFKVTDIAVRVFRHVTFTAQEFYTGRYVTKISNETFRYTFKLKHVILENVDTIGANAFESNTALETVTGSRVVSIGNNAFYGCTALKIVSFPVLNTIGSSAFYNTRIVELDLPMVSTVNASAFANNPALVTASFGDKALTLASNVFSNCSSLREVVFRSEIMVKGPANNDLFGDSSTTTPIKAVMIIVRESVKDEYTKAQAGATWQKIPCDISEGGVCNIDSFELSSYDAVKNVTFYYSFLEGDKVELSFMRTTETSFTGSFVFPSSFTVNVVVGEGEEATVQTITYRVTRISDGFLQSLALYAGITEYILPSDLEHFTNNFAAISSSLESLVIADTNDMYSTVDGVLYNREGTILLYYPKAKSDISFTISSSVKMINENAFAGNLILQHIIVEGDIIFGLKAFEGCTYLERVTFESLTPSYFVGKGTFENCSQVLVIYVPEAALDLYKQNALIDEDLSKRMQASE